MQKTPDSHVPGRNEQVEKKNKREQFVLTPTYIQPFNGHLAASASQV